MVKLFFKDGSSKNVDIPFNNDKASEWRMKEMVNGDNDIVKIEVELKMTQTFRREKYATN